MAISWGSWDYGGGNGMRVGIDVSWESISSGETGATATIKIYTQNQYNINDYMDLNYSGGSISGSKNFLNNSSTGSGTVKRDEKTYTYNYPSGSYGSSPSTRTFKAQISGAYFGGTPYKTVTSAVPARPYATPTAPSAVVAVRDSDTQATVSWTRNVTSQRPYTSQTLQYRTFENDSWGSWVTVGTISGSATSYAHTGREANRAYQYQIRANNSVGSSGYVASNNIYMSPAAPSNVVAAASTDALSINLTWTNNHYAATGITLDIERSVNGGAWGAVATGLAYNVTSWTDAAPGAGTNQYRIKSIVPVGPLPSAWVLSNTVSTIIPPLAPTLLNPNGTNVDLNNDLTLTWQHNQGGDGALQSHFRIRYSINGGVDWTVLADDIASSTQSYLIPGGTLPNDETYTWQVQTQGSTTVAYGPYSTSATFTGADSPVVNLIAPDPVTNFGPIVAEWTYSQTQGHPQTQWSAGFFDNLGNALEVLTGSDDATEVTFSAPIEDGKTYVIKVSARSSDGLWSPVDEIETLIDLLPPVTPTIAGSYNECSGSVSLFIEAPEPVEGETLVIDRFQIQRSINGGPWIAITRDIEASEVGLITVYYEDFEADDGGWAGMTLGDAFALPVDVQRSETYQSEGDASLEIEWGASGSEFAGFEVTDLVIGQSYSYVATVLVIGDADVRLAVDTDHQTDTIITPGFGEDEFSLDPFGSWKIATVIFTATATSHVIGIKNLMAEEDTFAYLDRATVYQGTTEGYETSQLVVTFIDPIPSTTGLNSYRAIAYAENQSTAISNLAEVQGTDGGIGAPLWAFLSYGESFQSTLRVRGDLATSAASSRNRSAVHFSGRRLPVALLGEQIDRVLTVGGTLRWVENCPVEDECLYDSSRDDWERASWVAEVVCYRDHTGRRIFGLLGDVQTTDTIPGMAQLSFAVGQLDYTEQTGLSPVVEDV